MVGLLLEVTPPPSPEPYPQGTLPHGGVAIGAETPPSLEPYP